MLDNPNANDGDELKMLDNAESSSELVSHAMQSLIRIRLMLLEILVTLKVKLDVVSAIRCTVFEDNNGALILASKQHMTSRTKYLCRIGHMLFVVESHAPVLDTIRD